MRAWINPLLAGAAMAVTVSLISTGPAFARPSWEDARLERLAQADLQAFPDELAYRRYVRSLRQAQRDIYFDRRRGLAGAGGDVIVVAQADLAPCDPQYEECIYGGGEEETIVVTGSRVVASLQSSPLAVTSITNNQVAAVDEGDIVKRIGDYLLVLQDGRIHVANFRTMALTDRIDVYRRDADGDPAGADWYDEMLVQGDHIIVTAYSYEDEATELSVFRLDQASGQVTRRGVFLISSEDYYDSDNYATRVVGDQLVLYSQFEPEDLVDRRHRPVIRRLGRAEDFDGREKGGNAMLSATDIRQPVFAVEEPSVHMVSVCQLDRLDRDDLPCDTTGFIAGEEAEMFVAGDNVYLATTAASGRDLWDWASCRTPGRASTVSPAAAPGAVFRVPLHGRGDTAEPDLLAVRGMVIDQFSMDQQASRFRMVSYWPSYRCGERSWPEREAIAPELTDQAVGSFTTRWRQPPEQRFTALPAAGEGVMESRFVGDWLLYGTRTRYGRPPATDDDEVAEPASLVAVPLGQPRAPVRLALGHEITRLESLGGDAIATGYRDEAGLTISYIDLGDSARVADQVLLARRFESEGRSHAFNATRDAAGNGFMGLPTVLRSEEADRYPWRSDNSQISFLSFGPGGNLADIGQVAPTKPGSEEDEGESVDCEVSCTDWYGNARPIFIDRMAYALLGTELVELRPAPDRVEVLRRLALTRVR